MYACFTAAMVAMIAVLVIPMGSLSSVVNSSSGVGPNDNQAFDEVESNLMIDEGCPNY